MSERVAVEEEDDYGYIIVLAPMVSSGAQGGTIPCEVHVLQKSFHWFPRFNTI